MTTHTVDSLWELVESYCYDIADSTQVKSALREALAQPATETQQITADRVTRMVAAIESECDGFGITRENATAILIYVLAPAAQPAAETKRKEPPKETTHYCTWHCGDPNCTAPRKHERAQQQEQCNCGAYLRGHLTAGWICPVHGQQW
jgi:hypothetical protein